MNDIAHSTVHTGPYTAPGLVLTEMLHRANQIHIKCLSGRSRMIILEATTSLTQGDHYDGLLATMPSADFCLITCKVPKQVLCPVVVLLSEFARSSMDSHRIAWTLNTVAQLLFSATTCIAREQISPDKNVNCHCTTLPFTVSHEPMGFVDGAYLKYENIRSLKVKN